MLNVVEARVSDQAAAQLGNAFPLVASFGQESITLLATDQQLAQERRPSWNIDGPPPSRHSNPINNRLGTT